MRRWKAHRGKVASLSFSRDGRLLASVTGSGRDIFIWDALTGQLLRTLGVPPDHPDPANARVQDVAFAPGVDALALVRHCRLEVRDTTTWAVVATASRPPDAGVPIKVLVGSGANPTILGCSTDLLSAWVFSPTVASDSRLAPTHSRKSTLRYQAGFSPCGRQLVWHTTERLEVFDPVTGEVIASYDHPKTNYAGPACFSSDAARIAYCRTRVIESLAATLDNPNEVIRYKGHVNTVWVLRYTPDGRSLVSASSDGTVRVWEAATGLQKRVFEMNVGKMAAADVSPDGTMAAVGGATGEIVVWDLE